MTPDIMILLRYALYFVDYLGFAFMLQVIFPSLLLFFFLRQFLSVV